MWTPEPGIPPGPRGYPIVGALPALRRDALRFLTDVTQTYGDVVRLGKMGKHGVFFVSHPEDIKQVCAGRAYTKGLNRGTLDLLGRDAMALLDGDAWVVRRRLLQPVFRGKQLAAYLPLMQEVLLRTFQRWDRTIGNGAIIDVQQEMMRLSLDIIARTLFSTDIDVDDPSLRRAVSEVLHYIGARMWSPINLPASIPTPSNRRFLAARAVIDATLYRIIAARRASNTDHDDILGRILTARDEGTGAQLTDSQVHDELMSFFIAGHETTATLLTWIWYVHAQNPDPRWGTDDEYTYRAIQETLRLYPPGWAIGRRCVQEDILGGYSIAPQSMIMVSPYITHRRADLWPEPHRFDPNRFLPAYTETRHRFAYLPFGAGPFACIANTFAMQQAHLIVIQMLQRYVLRLLPHQQVTPHPSFALRPRRPMMMALQRRSAASP